MNASYRAAVQNLLAAAHNRLAARPHKPAPSLHGLLTQIARTLRPRSTRWLPVLAGRAVVEPAAPLLNLVTPQRAAGCFDEDPMPQLHDPDRPPLIERRSPLERVVRVAAS